MRKSAFILLASITLGIGAIAQANEGDRGDRRSGPFEFKCEYMGHDGYDKGDKGGKDGKGGSFHRCTAEARVNRFNDSWFDVLNEGGGDHDRDRDHRHDRLAVACDDRLIYSDGAIHRSFGAYEFLVGAAGGNPVLKYSSSLPKKDESFIIPSWLKIGETVMEGFCAVREKDDRDHHDMQ